MGTGNTIASSTLGCPFHQNESSFSIPCGQFIPFWQQASRAGRPPTVGCHAGIMNLLILQIKSVKWEIKPKTHRKIIFQIIRTGQELKHIIILLIPLEHHVMMTFPFMNIFGAWISLAWIFSRLLLSREEETAEIQARISLDGVVTLQPPSYGMTNITSCRNVSSIEHKVNVFLLVLG